MRALQEDGGSVAKRLIVVAHELTNDTSWSGGWIDQGRLIPSCEIASGNLGARYGGSAQC